MLRGGHMGVGLENNVVLERACEDLNGRVPVSLADDVGCAARSDVPVTHHRRTGSKPGNCLRDRPPQPYNKRVG